MNLGLKIIRQTSRRFVSGIAGNFRPSKGLAGAIQESHPCYWSNKHKYSSNNNINSGTEAIRDKVMELASQKAPSPKIERYGFLHVFIFIIHVIQPIGNLVLFAMIVNLVYYRDQTYNGAKPTVSEPKENLSVSLKKDMEEMGVNREFLVAKIAKLKQVKESGLSSQDDRVTLQIYEGWLRTISKVEEKDPNDAGGS